MKVGKQENALIVVFYFVLCSLKDVGFFTGLLIHSHRDQRKDATTYNSYQKKEKYKVSLNPCNTLVAITTRY